jgi:hypothetical protein
MQSLSWGFGSLSRIQAGPLSRSVNVKASYASWTAWTTASRSHHVAAAVLRSNSLLPTSALQIPSPRPLNKHRRTPNFNQKRYCSHRRNMCRAADSGSAVVTGKVRQVLPTDVKPLHYALTLEPNLKTFEYNGEVAIE